MSETVPRASVLEQQTIRALSRRVLPIMFLMYFFAYVDRTVLGFAQLKMGIELGVDPAAFGLAAGIFYAGYILLEVPSNSAMNRLGARIWLTRIGVSWGVVTILTGFVQNETQLLIARFLLGAAEAGLAPGLILFALKLYPHQHRGKANSAVFLGTPVASALAGPLSGIVLDNAGWFGMSSWRWLFVLVGVPALALGVLTYTRLADSAAEATWLTVEQRRWLVDALANESAPPPHAGSAFLASLRNPTVLMLGGTYLLIISGSYSLAVWSPQIVKGLAGNVSATALGFLVMVPYAVGAVFLYANGAHSDRSGERLLHSFVPLFLSGAALVTIPLLVGNPVAAFVLIIVAVTGVNGFSPPFWAMVQRLLTGPNAAVALAVVTTIGNFGGLVSPYVVGVLTAATGSTGAGVTFLGLGVLLAAVLIGLGHRRWNREPADERTRT